MIILKEVGNMEKNIEKELKVLVSSKDFFKLLKQTPDVHVVKQINTYYDSEDFSVRKSRGSMRIRQIGDTHIFTLKKHGREGVMEFEKELPDSSIDSLDDAEVQHLLRYYKIEGPFEEKAKLTTFRGTYETPEAHICFDRNIYSGVVDYEIEYEYKFEHDGVTKFNNFLQPINKVYKRNCTSKIRRAINKNK